MHRTAPLLLFTLLALAAPAQAQQWFKGNTHSHARTWLPIPHGDSSPRRMARWYKEHGYQFLVLSDHNRAGRERRAKGLEDGGFVLISGAEVTSDTRLRLLYRYKHPSAPTRVVHTTALGIDPARFDTDVWQDFGPSSTVEEILRKHREATERAGGLTILNHPNFRDPITAQDVIGAGIGLFEVYNSYPHSDNEGDAHRPSTEALWDQVLSAGHRLYGIASDDAHHTKRWNRRLTEELDIRADPGGGWIMVRAQALTPGAILAAIQAGEFYASSGVHLAALERDAQRLVLAVDLAASEAELAKEHVWRPAPAAPGEQPGVTITFVTQGGQTLRTVAGLRAELDLSEATGYVRARVRLVAERDGELKAFCAWTQPVFVGGAASAAATSGDSRGLVGNVPAR